jgi:hypothetical protein
LANNSDQSQLFSVHDRLGQRKRFKISFQFIDFLKCTVIITKTVRFFRMLNLLGKPSKLGDWDVQQSWTALGKLLFSFSPLL